MDKGKTEIIFRMNLYRLLVQIISVLGGKIGAIVCYYFWNLKANLFFTSLEHVSIYNHLIIHNTQLASAQTTSDTGVYDITGLTIPELKQLLQLDKSGEVFRDKKQIILVTILSNFEPFD